MQDPDSPEGLAAAERRYMDFHPAVQAAHAALGIAIEHGRATREALALATNQEDILDAIAAALTGYQAGRDALAAFREAEEDARKQWRGHLALGFD